MAASSMKFTEIVKKTDKAVCFKIEDQDVWLPKSAIMVIGDTVSSPVLATQLRMAAAGSESRDLGPIVWKNPNGKSVAYDTVLTLDEGDPELSTTKIRVFVPTSQETGGQVPMWLIQQSLERQAPQVLASGEAYTLRSHDGTPVITGGTASIKPDADPVEDEA